MNQIKIVPEHAGTTPRECFITVAVGQQGVGKSYQNKIVIRDCVQGNPAKGIKSRRALIMDFNDEYTYLKAIHPKDVVLFSLSNIIEARRIRFIKDDGSTMSLAEQQDLLGRVLKDFRNGLLVVEDINAYVTDNVKQDTIGSLVNVRHRSVDVLISMQGIGRIVPKIWQNLRFLRLHKIQEAMARHASKFEEKLTYFTIAENILNNRYNMGDERFFVYIDCRSGKIYGRYTPIEFEEAVKQYIYVNYKRTISPLLLQRNVGSGSLRYNETTAVKFILDQYSKTFSQFSSK